MKSGQKSEQRLQQEGCRYEQLISTWDDAQQQWASGKCKLNPQYDTTRNPLEW